MPRLGFGVYQNYNTKPSVLEAFKAGYRLVKNRDALLYIFSDRSLLLGMSIPPMCIETSKMSVTR